MAHFVRPLALALSLDHARYEVAFRSPPRFAHLLNSCNFDTGPLDTMPGEQFLANLATGSPLFPTNVIREYVRQDRDLIRSFRPNLVIGDMRPSLSLSARLERTPSAILMNAYWSPYAERRSIIPELPLTRVVPPRLLSGVYRLTEPIAHAVHVRPTNIVRRECGLPPLPSDLRAMYTDGDWILYPDVPEFVPTPNRPANHIYVGACDWTAPVARPEWWDSLLRETRPVVFISLGSSGPLRAFPSLVKALDKLPVAVVLATSGRDLGDIPSRWRTARLLPFTETAKLARVVVSHGGSGGLYPAMTAGTPVLGIPSNADQHLSTSFLASQGAGLGVRVEEASTDRLYKALDELICNQSYVARARYWAERFTQFDTGAHFRAFLEGVLLTRP